MKTRKTKTILTFLFTFLFVLGCKEEKEILEREYPRINTLEVTSINTNGATFNADFKYRGDFEITRYGFIWSELESQTFPAANKVIYETNLQKESYSKEITTTLEKDRVYYVKAFVETEDLRVFGNQVSFTSLGSTAPKLRDFYPKTAEFNDTINLIGENFSYTENQVKFNETNAKVVYNSDTLLKVIVPEQLAESKSYISVSIKNNSFTFQEETFNIPPPVIINISPKSAKSKDTVRIDVKNIGSSASHIELSVKRGMVSDSIIWQNIEILNYEKESITFIVPNKLQNQNTLKIKIADIGDSVTLNYLKPEIISYAKQTIYWNDTLKFQTKNFYTDQKLYSIKLNDKKIAPLLATDSLVSIIFPEDLNSIQNALTFDIAGFTYRQQINLKQPTIEKLNLDSINFGDTVIIEGINFHPNANQIRVSNRFSIEPLFQSRSVLQFIIPQREDFPFQINMNNYDSLSFSVIALSDINSNSLDLKLIKPNITSISEVSNDQEIILKGYNLGDNPSLYLNSYFQFGTGLNSSAVYNNPPFLTVIESSDKEVKFKVDFDNELDINRWYEEFSFSLNFNIGLRSNGYNLSDTNTYQFEFNRPYSIISNSIFDLQYDYKRDNPELLFNNNFGFVIGGYGPRPPRWSQRSYLRDFYQFNPLTNQWIQLEDWSKASSESVYIKTSFLKNDQIYVITQLRTFLKYDLNNGTWSELAPLSNIDKCLGYFSQNNQDYIVTDYEIYELDVLSSTINLVGYLPDDIEFDYSRYSYSFQENNKVRILFDNKEYELNENTFEWSLVSELEIPASQQIFNFNNNTYYLDNTGLYNKVSGEAIEIFSFSSDEIKLLFLFENQLIIRRNNQYNITVELN